MFSWICPQCGKDVPPSKTECPYCAERAREFAAQQAQQPQPPAEQQARSGSGEFGQYPPRPAFEPQRPAYEAPPQRMSYEPPPVAPPPPPSQQHMTQQAPPYPPPSQQHQPMPGAWPPQQPYQMPHGQPPHWGPPAHKKPTPTWLLGLGFALAILGVGAAVYFGVQHFGRTNPQERAGLENPANPSKARVANPLQKYVEVVGIRLVSDSKKRPVAKFIVVSHSNSTIEGLAANVTLWASTSRSEEDSVASFNFHLPRLGPNESKELTEPLKTKLKPYELPDWQNANADVQITAPQAPAQ